MVTEDLFFLCRMRAMVGSKKEGERREKWPKGENSLSVLEKIVEVCIGA